MAAAELAVDEGSGVRRRGHRPLELAVDVEVGAIRLDVHDVEVVLRVAVLDVVHGDYRRRGVVAGEDEGAGGRSAAQHNRSVAVLEVHHDSSRLGAERRDDGDRGGLFGREHLGVSRIRHVHRGVDGVAARGLGPRRRPLVGPCRLPGAGVGQALAVERHAEPRFKPRDVHSRISACRTKRERGSDKKPAESTLEEFVVSRSYHNLFPLRVWKYYTKINTKSTPSKVRG